MKKKKPLYKIIYWLFGIILSFGILYAIAGRRIGDMITSRGIELYEARKYNEAEKYFKIAGFFSFSSSVNNYYIIENRRMLGISPTVEDVRKLLKSKDASVINKGLEMAKHWKMLDLRSDIITIAQKGSIEVSDAADEVLQFFAYLATPFRCAACGVRYTASMPQGNLPFICARCRNHALYPEDRFTLAKLHCNSCGNSFVIENIPGRTLQSICPKCGSSDAKQMYRCTSCSHTWGGSGFVTSCAKCKSSQVGSVSVTPEEANQFRGTK